MSAHKLGVHWIPVHNRRGDVEYIRRLQPRSVKIVNPDVQQVSDAFVAAPGALFVLRDHALSEQHGDVARDPVGTGVRHARELAAWVGRMEGQARERGLPFPGRERIITPGLNEGKVWEALEAVALYNVALCEEGTRLGARMLAGNLSVGWPGDGGAANTPPDWRPFAGLHDAILGGPHMLGFHEYFGQQGPEFYGDWWFNRIGQCPWRGARWEGRMLCGELGMARAFQHADGSWGLDGGRGWVGLVDGATYVAMVRRALQVYRADRRIYDAQLFTTDGTTEHWHTFETESIHDQLVAMAMGLAGEPLPVEPLPVEPSPGEGSGAGHTVNLPVVIAPPAGVENGGAENGGAAFVGVGLAMDPLVVEAVLAVEAGGSGFEGGRVKVRVEAHLLLSERWGRPKVFAPYFEFNRDNILEAWFRQTPQGQWIAYHGDQRREWEALSLARRLDDTTAIRCTSWGAGQVMGFNHKRVGYGSPQAMAAAMGRSEAAQVVAMVNYLLSDPALVEAMRRRDWREIARRYNGSGLVDLYAPRLQAAYERLVKGGRG